MNTRIDGASCQIIPDDLYTSGEPSLNRLAAAAGDRFDVWQRQINRIILAKSADGFWSARNTVLSIPRQTGKTYDIGWIAIHRAARTPGMRIVWTAQHFSVIKDTFESLCAIVLRPEMSGLVDPDHGISLAAGKEEIRFRNGSRIFFRARERGALRGVKKIALLVIDEAQHLSDSAMASMLPTQNRAWNPQTIYMGTPPGRLDLKASAGRVNYSNTLNGVDPRLAPQTPLLRSPGDLHDLGEVAAHVDPRRRFSSSSATPFLRVSMIHGSLPRGSALSGPEPWSHRHES